jgi:hypothetical protein
MRRLALAILAAFAVSGPALAEGEGGAPAPGGSTVLMSPVALPIVVDGKLVNYIFVTLRLHLSANADAVRLRTMEPYFRDALVRVGHRTPFVRPDNYTVLDDNRLSAAVLSQAVALAGPGQVVSVQIVREQAQHFENLPKPAGQPRR